jgi:hypothetical protein
MQRGQLKYSRLLIAVPIIPENEDSKKWPIPLYGAGHCMKVANSPFIGGIGLHLTSGG